MKLIYCLQLIIGISVFALTACGQSNSDSSFTKAEIEEFELINLCHCTEYLFLRERDYVKWKSKEAKERSVEESKREYFHFYNSLRLHSHFYQSKYDSSQFFQQGISVLYGSKLNFKRLDSLYYEPLVKYYVTNISKTENLPYLGFGDINYFFECYYKVKEIPLEEELKYFIDANYTKARQ